jgi:hypothetical protein
MPKCKHWRQRLLYKVIWDRSIADGSLRLASYTFARVVKQFCQLGKNGL